MKERWIFMSWHMKLNQWKTTLGENDLQKFFLKFHLTYFILVYSIQDLYSFVYLCLSRTRNRNTFLCLFRYDVASFLSYRLFNACELVRYIPLIVSFEVPFVNYLMLILHSFVSYARSHGLFSPLSSIFLVCIPCYI